MIGACEGCHNYYSCQGCPLSDDEEPEYAYNCSECGEGIEHDHYCYFIDGKVYCQDCIESFSFPAVRGVEPDEAFKDYKAECERRSREFYSRFTTQ